MKKRVATRNKSIRSSSRKRITPRFEVHRIFVFTTGGIFVMALLFAIVQLSSQVFFGRSYVLGTTILAEKGDDSGGSGGDSGGSGSSGSGGQVSEQGTQQVTHEDRQPEPTEKPRPTFVPEHTTVQIHHEIKKHEVEQENEQETETHTATGDDDVKIASDGAGETKFERRNVTARTHFPLSIDTTTNQLVVTTPAGQKVVTVLPDEAVQHMLSTGVINALAPDQKGSESSNVEFTVENNEPVYKIAGLKHFKFLGFIPVSQPVTAVVSSETGNEVSTEEPFFTKLVDLLSP